MEKGWKKSELGVPMEQRVESSNLSGSRMFRDFPKRSQQKRAFLSSNLSGMVFNNFCPRKYLKPNSNVEVHLYWSKWRREGRKIIYSNKWIYNSKSGSAQKKCFRLLLKTGALVRSYIFNTRKLYLFYNYKLYIN